MHWLLDVAQQLARDKIVLDAFVIERTHLRVKAVAEPIKNTRVFERSVLASLASVTWNRASTDAAGNGLLGRTSALPELAGAVVADRMEFYSIEVAVDDVVSRSGDIGIVVACCQSGPRLFALVKRCGVAENISDHSKVCALGHAVEAWPVSEFRLCLAWRRRPDGSLLVVLE